jgi:serine/tyrosine/threonine adenylyltransferase
MRILESTYAQLPQTFYSLVSPEPVPGAELLAFNEELALELDLLLDPRDQALLTELFSGAALFPGSTPLAMAYSGHQFGHFNPHLGDGRALLLGEVLTANGLRFDLQLKGSGKTPYSRRGDGKSALGPVVREYLLSEAMHGLGLPTTRALAAVKTGEQVWREERRAGGIFTRVASSHLRIGTFEHFAAREDFASLRFLTDFAIARHTPEALKEENPALAFFRLTADKLLTLVSRWMQIGFIHGVMNTDNTTISGETLDYGPCAFMDEFKFHQVFSSIDQSGRYSYTNQGPIICWNLTRLAGCLVPMVSESTEEARELMQNEVNLLPEKFQSLWLKAMAAKLGFTPSRDTQAEDQALVQEWLTFLEKERLDFTNAHTMLSSSKIKEIPSSLLESLSKRQAPDAKALMSRSNPIIIPRNHLVEQAIQEVYAGKTQLFNRLHQAWKYPFTKEQDSDLTAGPREHERVTKTFCGT